MSVRWLVVMLLAFSCTSPASPGAIGTIESPRPLPTFRLPTFSGEAGVWIAFPDGRAPLVALNPDRQFVAASLYKLGVLVEVERRVDASALRYTDTITILDVDVTADGSNVPAGTSLRIDEALEEMIISSDNGSALALLRMVGAEAVNATLARESIGGFALAATPDDDNLVTAKGVASLLTRLARHELVSRPASERMLARLARQLINDRLPARLPADVVVAHKTGDLVGFTHDAGIINAPRRAVIAVALTEGASRDEAVAFIASAGLLAYEAGSAVSAIGPGAAAAASLPGMAIAGAVALASVLVYARSRRPGGRPMAVRVRR